MDTTLLFFTLRSVTLELVHVQSARVYLDLELVPDGPQYASILAQALHSECEHTAKKDLTFVQLG